MTPRDPALDTTDPDESASATAGNTDTSPDAEIDPDTASIDQQGSERPSAGRSASIMAIATLASRGLGFIKTSLLIIAIGGTSNFVGGQVFDVANSAPTQLYGLIAGGVLGAILVPQIVSALGQGAEGKARLDRLLSVTIVGAALFTVLLTLAAPAVVFVSAAKWSPSWLGLAAAMAYWCLPQVFFFIVYTVLAQILNAKNVFGPPAWAPAISNLVAIAGIVYFLVAMPSGRGGVESWTPLMIAVLCGSATLGVIVQSLILIRPLKQTGFRFRFRFGVTGLRGASTIALWTFSSAAIGQLALLVSANFGNEAGHLLNTAHIEGPSNNSLSYAYLLLLLPHGIGTVSLATAMFTRMSESAAAKKYAEVAKNLDQTMSVVAYLSIAATVYFLALGPLLTQLLWQTPIIGQVLQVLSISLIGFSQAYVINRGLFAMHDGRSPFINQVAASVVAATGSLLVGLLFPPELVVLGIAGAISLSTLVSWALAAWLFKRRIRLESGGTVPRQPQRAEYVKALVAGAAALAVTVVANLIADGWGPRDFVLNAITLAVLSLLGIAVFVGVGLVLRDRRITGLLAIVRQRRGR